MKGLITNIVSNKGFGFIRDEQGVDRFFHANDCETPFSQLKVRLAVTFEPFEESGRGNRARKVKVEA